MSGLLEELLSGPSAQERALNVLAMTQQPGGGAGRTRPIASGSMGAGTAPHQLALKIGSWIDNKPGFSVGGLEGYRGQGPITSGHIENSQHYSGMAGDVSYNGGGRFGGEMAALDWLERALQRRWGDSLTELLWRVPDHYDHLHYGTRPGG